MVLGNPFLLASDFTPTVTYGIVSGVVPVPDCEGDLLRVIYRIQIDASINPGNSGGPSFDIQMPLDRYQRSCVVRKTRSS